MTRSQHFLNRHRVISRSLAISDQMLISLSMNYNNDANTHQQLIDNLKNNSLINSKCVEDVMRCLDRSHFCRGSSSTSLYHDKPQVIGPGVGQNMTSPHMHAIALETCQSNLRPGMTALDVGSGSGYLTACMALLVNDTDSLLGRVIGVDNSAVLVEQSKESIRKANPEAAEMMEQHRLQFIVRDMSFSTEDGDVDHEEDQASIGVFNCIHVGAAMDRVPQQLLDWLHPENGILIIPITIPNSTEQNLFKIVKTPYSSSTDSTSLSKSTSSLWLGESSVLQPDGQSVASSTVIMKCGYSAMSRGLYDSAQDEAKGSSQQGDDPVAHLQAKLEEHERCHSELAKRLHLWQQAYKKRTNNSPPFSLAILQEDAVGTQILADLQFQQKEIKRRNAQIKVLTEELKKMGKLQ